MKTHRVRWYLEVWTPEGRALLNRSLGYAVPGETTVPQRFAATLDSCVGSLMAVHGPLRVEVVRR